MRLKFCPDCFELITIYPSNFSNIQCFICPQLINQSIDKTEIGLPCIVFKHERKGPVRVLIHELIE